MSIKKVSILSGYKYNHKYFVKYCNTECKIFHIPNSQNICIRIDYRDFTFIQNMCLIYHDYYSVKTDTRFYMTFSDFCNKHKNFVKKYFTKNIMENYTTKNTTRKRKI